MKYDTIPKEKLEALSPADRKNLKALAQKLEQSEMDARALGEILPDAVLLGDKPQKKVSKSMIEVTENAITFSIARDPEKISTALFPIIGSAIKKAVNNMMSEMMTAINTSMENLLSYKRMLWRIESVKTGIPFVEIVMKNSMHYRVEHVFLIHRKTSLLLHHLSKDDSFPTDSDIVASMLTAVQDYIKDSLSLETRDTVHSISTGEYTILIEDGPKAIIASVVKGVVDSTLQDRMIESLEAVHRELAQELNSFAGDTEPFQREESLLQPCLISHLEKEKKKPVYAIILLSVFFIACSVFGFILFQSASLHKEFIRELNAEPGILVASETKKIRRYELRVLKDSRSRSIQSIALSRGINLKLYDFTLEEFISPAFGGINMIEESGIPGELLKLSRELQDRVLLFESDSEAFREDQQDVLSDVGQLIEEILILSNEKNLELSIEIIGHSAGNIQDTESIQVSQDRASMVYSFLEKTHPDLSEKMTALGVGISSPVVKEEENEEDRIMNRSVTFKVFFE